MLNHILAAMLLKKTDRVLDVGCADGALALELARYAGYVTGVDDCDEYVAAADNKMLQSGMDNLSFQRIEPGRLPFDDETFDAVISCGAIHHFEDPSGMIVEMVRVLKPSGRLYLADIVGAEDKTKREAHAKIDQARHRRPTTLFSPSGLRALIPGDAVKIVDQARWSERLRFEDWMPPDEATDSQREKVSRMLVTAAKKKTTDLKIEVSGKNITLDRHWTLITAEKTGAV